MKDKLWLSVVVAFMAAVGPMAHAQTSTRYNITDLGHSLGTNSHAHAINGSGQVVGYWDTVTNGIHAFLYTNGVVSDLGALGGTNTFALNINAAGHVIGVFTISNTNRAFLFDGVVTNLGGLGGDQSYAFGINSSGKIVGYVDTTNGARFPLGRKPKSLHKAAEYMSTHSHGRRGDAPPTRLATRQP